MSRYKFGEVVLLQFPFTGGGGYKKRPALILFDRGDADIIVAHVTSQAKTETYDIEIKEWRTAGLRIPSIVRLHKIATFEKTLIDQKIGDLHPSDVAEIKKQIVEILKNI